MKIRTMILNQKLYFFSEEMLQEQPFLGVLGEKYF